MQVRIRTEQQPGTAPAGVEGEAAVGVDQIFGRAGDHEAVAKVAPVAQDLLEQVLDVAGVQQFGVVDQHRQRSGRGVKGTSQYRSVRLGLGKNGQHTGGAAEPP